MENYNKIDVTELFHTYGNDFQKNMNDAEETISRLKSLSAVNPNNKTVFAITDDADELLNNAEE